MRMRISICLTPISKLVILFAMLIAMTEKLDYGDIDAMKYQFSMAGLVKKFIEMNKICS